MKFNITRFLCLFLFVLAFCFRIYQLDQTTVYPDEVSWMVRGKEAVYALKQRNLDYFRYSVWWGSKKESEAIGLPLSLTSGAFLILVGQGQGSVSLNLFKDYVAARIPQVLIGSLFIPVFFLLSSKIYGRKVSLLASVLLAIDPVYIGLSRWVINDPVLLFTSFCALILFPLGVRKKSKKYIILSGVFLALAFLTKPQGLLPIASWVVYLVFYKENIKRKIWDLCFSLSTALFIITIIWPGSWINPFYSIFEYIYRQSVLVKIGIAYYYFGHVSVDQPWTVYIFEIFTRLPLFASLGLIVSPVFIYTLFKSTSLKNSRSEMAFPFSIIAYIVTHIVFISLSNLNQGVRYVLPLWPWLYLLIAWTYLRICSHIKNVLVKILIIFILIFGSLIGAFEYHPEQMLFYNSLIGGASGAQKYDLVGRCYGIKEAAEYVRTCFPQVKSMAILGCSNVVAPYYYGGKITTDWKNENIVVVENAFKQLLPNEEAIRYFDQLTPEHNFYVKGAIVARIYLKEKNIKNICD